MNFIEEFKSIINNEKLKKSFISCSHLKQARIFGFVTTNIRDVSSFVVYINELVPIYQDFENNNDLVGWKNYCRQHLDRDKQKYKRLEEAKIIFRNVENNSHLNNNAKIFYKILNETNSNILTLFLSFYILTGRYFDIDKQPIVEIEKILNSYNGDILQDGLKCLNNDEYNNLLFAVLFYNKKEDLFYDLSYYLIENFDSDLEEELNFLNSYIEERNNILISNSKTSKATHAGGINNFRSDVFLIINYFIFKNICRENYELFQKDIKQFTEKVFNEYVEIFFDYKLNNFLKIKDNEKDILKKIFYKYKDLLCDIFYSALGLTEDEILKIASKKRKQNIKFESIEKYGYKCFMHCCHCDEELHDKMYFKNKKGKIYLEGHHVIQIENAKLFNNSLDVIENVIPLCPNCHRKIHNAENKEVAKMLKIIYNNLDKRGLMRKGIFVDLNTLTSFYGLEDIKDNEE